MEIKYATPSECGRLFTDDEWPCLVPKADESDQVMVGVTLKALTSIFPWLAQRQLFTKSLIKLPLVRKTYCYHWKYQRLLEENLIFFGINYESCHPKVIYTL